MNHLCYSVGNCSLKEGMNCARAEDCVILGECRGYGVDETPGWSSQLLSLAALWCMRVAGSQVSFFQDRQAPGVFAEPASPCSAECKVMISDRRRPGGQARSRHLTQPEFTSQILTFF